MLCSNRRATRRSRGDVIQVDIDAIPEPIEAQVEFALNVIERLAKDRGDVIAKGLGCDQTSTRNTTLQFSYQWVR